MYRGVCMLHCGYGGTHYLPRNYQTHFEWFMQVIRMREHYSVCGIVLDFCAYPSPVLGYVTVK
jgi:hypothetical protein